MAGCDGGSSPHAKGVGCYLTAFFDELTKWGVREIVISPGSRSTGLAVGAYELSRRAPHRLRIVLDVDERGAAFTALGMAKASGRPVAVIGTSGTAIANYYPAVLEAETSRVPLIVLSGDRPENLQGVGAPQTMDQLKLFGDHVRMFRQMPEPAGDISRIRYVRQIAREACMHALGPGARLPPSEGLPIAARAVAHHAGPVQLNFPLEEPLMPDFAFGFSCEYEEVGEERLAADEAMRMPAAIAFPGSEDAAALDALIAQGGALVLAGEGSAETLEEAETIIRWAASRSLPLLADPLSGLRRIPGEGVIANYDNVWADPAALAPDVVIRFGRFPVSKRALQAVERACERGCVQVVIDAAERRDLVCHTDRYIACTPHDLASRSLSFSPGITSEAQEEYLGRWLDAEARERKRIAQVDEDAARCSGGAKPADADAASEGRVREPEGAYVRALLRDLEPGSVLWCANSMSIRALDTFDTGSGMPDNAAMGFAPIQVLGNRGLNGIDGTLSSAAGAALVRGRATLLTGDLSFLHDLNALALQQEFKLRPAVDGKAPGLTIVLLNNAGAAIFATLPQASEEGCFERLFLVPQTNRIEAAADAFYVPHRRVSDIASFHEAYAEASTMPGITLIEIPTELGDVRDRYAPYQG